MRSGRIRKTFRWLILVLLLLQTWSSPPAEAGDLDYFPGDFSARGLIGNSLPGSWRPFAADAHWNTPLPSAPILHPDSSSVMTLVTQTASSLRFGRKYLSPVWVVNGKVLPGIQVQSRKSFADWDRDRDGIADVPVPVTRQMYPEPTEDGHISIIDPFAKKAWEMSGFRWPEGQLEPNCGTFNVWDLTGPGAGDPWYRGWRWQTRGGRGSGFPLIAGLLRPEEIASGEIRHALIFTFPKNRMADDGSNLFIPPAARSDGKHKGRQYPVEGMRFALDPSLTEADFKAWGLTPEAQVVARALQRYGMFLGDNGGALALQVQLLGPDERSNRRKWDELFPGLYSSIENIPANRFRVVYTGEAVAK